jgi:5,10-methylenetetrahydrofolate reductase
MGEGLSSERYVQVVGHSIAAHTLPGITQPIIPGMMPIQNFASFRRLVNLTGCPVPQNILDSLEPIKVSHLGSTAIVADDK